MTQSKDDKITVTIDDYVNGEDIVIDLNDTYGTTTTYWANDSVTDIVSENSNDGTYTINIGDLTSDTIDLSGIVTNEYNDYSWAYENTKLDKIEVERMCEHYPALEKAWRNFKSVYDMVEQDWKGKKKAGEVDDDDLPF